MEEIDVGGLRIAYRRVGIGPPFVLLHGGPLDSREWRHQLDGLADEFTVVAWDMPGCGGSADPPEHFRTRDYADCLGTFIEALGLEQPHVLGLSFGSGLALEFYRWHPSIPRTLILASAYAGWAGSLPPEVAEQRKQQMLRRIELPPEQFASEFLPSLLTDSAPQELVDEARAILSDFHPAGQRALLRAGFAEHDVRDVLPRIDVPTLLLYGDRGCPLAADRGRGDARQHSSIEARGHAGRWAHGRHGGAPAIQRRGSKFPPVRTESPPLHGRARCPS